MHTNPLGRGVWDLGDDPAASAALKLIGNSWIVSQVEVASQCLALGEANGIECAWHAAKGMARPACWYMQDGGGSAPARPLVHLIFVAPHCCAASHILRMLDTFLKSPIPLGYAQRIAAGDYSTEARACHCFGQH